MTMIRITSSNRSTVSRSAVRMAVSCASMPLPRPDARTPATASLASRLIGVSVGDSASCERT